VDVTSSGSHLMVTFDSGVQFLGYATRKLVLIALLMLCIL
jgi:hypothetical protein